MGKHRKITIWERRKIRERIVKEINDLENERLRVMEEKLPFPSTDLILIRQGKLERLDAKIRDRQAELSFDVLESLEGFSEKLHSLTWVLVLLTTVLGILTFALLITALGLHVP